jgi:hypothetical protein
MKRRDLFQRERSHILLPQGQLEPLTKTVIGRIRKCGAAPSGMESGCDALCLEKENLMGLRRRQSILNTSQGMFRLIFFVQQSVLLV